MELQCFKASLCWPLHCVIEMHLMCSPFVFILYILMLRSKSFDILVCWYEECNYVLFQYFVWYIHKEILCHQEKCFCLWEISSHISQERLFWHPLAIWDFMIFLLPCNCIWKASHPWCSCFYNITSLLSLVLSSFSHWV